MMMTASGRGFTQAGNSRDDSDSVGERVYCHSRVSESGAVWALTEVPWLKRAGPHCSPACGLSTGKPSRECSQLRPLRRAGLRLGTGRPGPPHRVNHHDFERVEGGSSDPGCHGMEVSNGMWGQSDAGAPVTSPHWPAVRPTQIELETTVN